MATGKKITRSIQFRLSIGFGIMFLAVLVSLILVLQTSLRSELEQESARLIQANGAKIVAKLSEQTTLANTLAQSLAAYAESTPNSEKLFKSSLPSILDLANAQSIIAGGGFWPEPNQFSPGVERRSFFWGRNKEGQLQYFDDYNQPLSPGYHNEEWYVPAKLLNKGSCYWSRSYTDPYSKQPMVTCTVAVVKQGEFIGATTVDLRLEGIANMMRDLGDKTRSYAFAVDQNNKFITFPDEELIKAGDKSHNINTVDLSAKDARFIPLYQALDSIQDELLIAAQLTNNYKVEAINYLHENSYQISRTQAEIITAALAKPYQEAPDLLLKTVKLNDDIFFNAPVNVNIFHVPNAYWRLVVVTPQATSLGTVSEIIEHTLIGTSLPILLIMLCAYWGLRKSVINPITSITTQLRTAVESDKPNKEHLLDDSRQDELGELAYWYNQRTCELADAMHSISAVNRELSYYANYDTLTGLTNRRSFERKLRNLIDTNEWRDHALLYLDVDQFKVINDTCGHAAGDKLLVEIGKRLTTALSEEDTVARIGGDEFAIVAASPIYRATVRLAERVRKVVEELYFQWEDKSFKISCSIGAAQLADLPQDTARALMQVDNACYAAKDLGRNRVQFYGKDSKVLSHRTGEMHWLTRINEALENQRFFMEFQVIRPCHKDSGKLAIESLIRLRNDDGKVIYPGEFVPAAERYNTIYLIDRWAITNVLKELANNREFLENINYCSINISADSICNENTVEFIKNEIRRLKIEPKNICFEITETQVMHNLTRAKIALQELKDFGFRLALDDFGAGMSSYNYLKELPVDVVKIDGEFVRNIKRDRFYLTFVKSINDIARVMGLETVAEFVEENDTLELLQMIGVHYVQGNFVAEPLALETLINGIKEGKIDVRTL